MHFSHPKLSPAAVIGSVSVILFYDILAAASPTVELTLEASDSDTDTDSSADGIEVTEESDDEEAIESSELDAAGDSVSGIDVMEVIVQL